MAEDDPDDRLLIKDAIIEAGKQSIDVYFVQDGAEMLDFLYHRGKYEDQSKAPIPELVLLDLNMPKKGGMEVLQEIKSDPRLRTIPVVVLTTSRAPEHIARSYELGGNGFITKPNTYSELVEVMRNLKRYWFNTVELP
ncbi:MAG: response regulator [Chloroflexi bacterium]|nr:response regulator [Chloroflexota bacterium]